jgi:hypothetical protein
VFLVGISLKKDVSNSSTKLLITDQRNRLNPDIIEASECYISWVKSGLLNPSMDSGEL